MVSKFATTKIIGCFLFSIINRPLHRGKVTSTLTRTLMKWPPSSSTASIDFWTSPTVLHRFSAIFFVIYLTGISCTCTQKRAFIKDKSRTGTSALYLWTITKCLSKLQGWLCKIRSMSVKLSKTKSPLWSWWLRILKPFVDLHSCLKVLAIASILRKRGVRKSVAMMNSPVRWSLFKTNPVFSLSEREKLLHCSAKSSIFR